MWGFFIPARHPIRIRVSLAFIVSMSTRSVWLTAEGSSTSSEALSHPSFSQVAVGWAKRPQRPWSGLLIWSVTSAQSRIRLWWVGYDARLPSLCCGLRWLACEARCHALATVTSRASAKLQLMAKLHIENMFLLISDELIFNCISWSVMKFFDVFFLACRIHNFYALPVCVSFCIFFVNVSLFSLYMRTGVFLVFYCLIMFLLCALGVFRHCWLCFQTFLLDFAKKALFSSNLISSGRLTRGPPPTCKTADHGHLQQTACNLPSEVEIWHRRFSDLAMDPPSRHGSHVQRIRKKLPVTFFPTNRWPICQHPVHEVNTTHSLIVSVDKVRLLDIVHRLSFHTPSHFVHWSVGLAVACNSDDRLVVPLTHEHGAIKVKVERSHVLFFISLVDVKSQFASPVRFSLTVPIAFTFSDAKSERSLWDVKKLSKKKWCFATSEFFRTTSTMWLTTLVPKHRDPSLALSKNFRASAA